MGWVSPYIYEGIKYTAGDAIVVNGSYYYDISDTTPNGTWNETKYFHGVWVNDDGSLPLNPVGIRNASGQTNPNGGTMRFDSIVSGGTVVVGVGNFVAYVYDQNRNGGTANSANNGWFEGIYLDWNSWNAPAGIKMWEVWYRESSDGVNWSGRVNVGTFKSTNNYGNYRIGSVNQNSKDGNWGGRGYYYQWCVVGIDNNGRYSKTNYWSRTRRKCTVSAHTFNANGGSGAPGVQYKPISYNFVFPSAPSTPKTGHHFVGWNSSASASDGYAAGTNTSNVPDAPVTWYAIWEPNNYTLTLNANGGTVATTSCQVTYNSGNYRELSWNIPTRKGYIFNGWYTAKSGGTKVYGADGYCVNEGTYWSNASGSSKWKYTGNVTLYAQWTAKTAKVTFYRNYNSSDTTTKDVTYTVGVASQAFAAHWSRTGYTLLGWSATRSATTATYDPTCTVSEDWKNSNSPSTSLYAIWKINQYTLTIKPNGGSWGGTTSNSTAKQDYNSTKTIDNPTRKGYTFTGWTLSGGGSLNDTTYTYGTSDCTLTANWTANNYTVKYDANGGSGKMSNSTATYDSAFQTRQNAFTRAGHKFIGWNEKADGTGVNWGLTANGVYESGKTWKWAYDYDITLYAQWEKTTSVYPCINGELKDGAPYAYINGKWEELTIINMYIYGGWKQ